ncbi:uncharacterized protein [Maniola hyperantus]|uniref:uncharacterized protein n=1 Tax=Aphantopus hyperantus TaxID=2795564 RepID=UPI003749EC10
MKTGHNPRSGGGSCSCTTCVYKSESDHPPLRRVIDLGSRIDRLYYGKYIPLRERKLLERLVRTRAVYDDIRAQLVSDSTLSFSTKGDYNPRKKVSVRELDDTEKSSGAVFELVNMVDRGAMGSKELNECCSCCSCSSKIKIHEHKHRQHGTYAGAEEYLARQRRLRDSYRRKKGMPFKTKHIRSDPCTCTFKLIKKQSKAIYKKMHQRPPVSLFELQPDEEINQKRKRIGDIVRTSYQNLMDSKTRMKEKISEGISKFKESQTRIQEKIELQTKLSMEKFNQAKNKLASKVRTGAQKIKQINSNTEWQFDPENELVSQVEKDSISKVKEELRRKQILKDWECEPECIEEICVPEECFIKLKQTKLNRKNFHHQGMSYNVKTQERKAGESLRLSNYKIQARKFAKAKTVETDKPVLRAQQTQGIKGSRVGLNPKTLSKRQKVGVTNVASKKGIKTSVLKIIPVKTTPEKISVKNMKASYPVKKAKLENSSLERKSSQGQAARIGSSFSFNIEFYKDKPGQRIPVQSYRDTKHHPGIDYKYENPVKDKKTKKKHFRQRGSQIEFQKSLKDTQAGGHALKRCFCTLKLRAKANKSKIRHPVTKNVLTTEKSTLTLNSATAFILNEVQTNTDNKRKEGKKMRTKSNLLPYECEPGVCLPGQCDPYQCMNLINIREAKSRNSSTQARKTKSTASFTSRSYKPAKAKKSKSKAIGYRGKASKQVVAKQRIRRGNAIRNSHRQAVRIGSSFSFNVKFYTDSPYYEKSIRPPPASEIKSLSIKPKQKEYRKVKLRNRGYQGNLGNAHRNTPTRMIKKERARIGTPLRRCFCTLALQKKDIMKNVSKKTLTTSSETLEPKQMDTANKGTKTKLKYSKTLEPYECEPYTCIPGACDRYACLERINMRKKRQKEVDWNTDRHKTLLEPYECEPFTCIPGECDPYVCLERINKRNKRLKEVGLTTGWSKTRSSSSGNTYPVKKLKTAQVQYKPRHKERKVLAKTQKPKKHAEINSKMNDVTKYNSSAKSRQAVKIGSTFSFDIEFHKSMSPTQEIKQVYPTEKKNQSRYL